MANDSNDNNIESTLTSVLDHIESQPRRSTRNRTKQVLYPDQIAYSSGHLPKASIKVLETSLSSSFANFVSLRTAKSYEYMV